MLCILYMTTITVVQFVLFWHCRCCSTRPDRTTQRANRAIQPTVQPAKPSDQALNHLPHSLTDTHTHMQTHTWRHRHTHAHTLSHSCSPTSNLSVYRFLPNICARHSTVLNAKKQQQKIKKKRNKKNRKKVE